MLALNEPIARFVTIAHVDKSIILDKSIDQRIAAIVDLITIRIKDQSIDEVSLGLLEDIFDLRFEILEWLAANEKSTEFYTDRIQKFIEENLKMATFSDLANTVSSVLLAYDKIVSPVLKSSPDLFHSLLGDIQNRAPKYDTLKLLAYHPSPRISYFQKWVDTSLQMETGLILSDLVLSGQAQYSKKRIKSELVEFLYSVITRFGAYSIFTGFWTPDKTDESNLTNRMKILAATIELDNNLSYQTTKDGLFEIVNN